MEYAIQLKNVTKTFGKVVANKNVNLDVKKGEILSFWEKWKWQDHSYEYDLRYLFSRFRRDHDRR